MLCFFTVAYQLDRVCEVRRLFEENIQRQVHLFAEFERVERAALENARNFVYANAGLDPEYRSDYRPYHANYQPYQIPNRAPIPTLSPGARSDDTDDTVEFNFDDFARRSPSPVLHLGQPRSPSPVRAGTPRSPSPELIDVSDNESEEGQLIDLDVVLVDDDEAVGAVEVVGDDDPDANPGIPICSICTEFMFNRSPTVLRQCGHIFCGPCIEKWFEIRQTCPSCRVQVNNILRDVFRVYL